LQKNNQAYFLCHPVYDGSVMTYEAMAIEALSC